MFKRRVRRKGASKRINNEETEDDGDLKTQPKPISAKRQL
jgi:hypothetical protein